MNMNDKPSKSGKTVLVTGAAGGIGRATINLFSGSGWQVIGVDLDHGDVGVRIRAHCLRGEFPTVLQRYRHFVRVTHDVVVRDDVPVAGDDES